MRNLKDTPTRDSEKDRRPIRHQEKSNSTSHFLSVKVKPNSPRTEVLKISEDQEILLAVSAVPEEGKANNEVIKFFSKKLKAPRERIVIVQGGKTTKKTIKITREGTIEEILREILEE